MLQDLRTGTGRAGVRPNLETTTLTAWILLAHAGATCAMAGLIWFVQVVHYPLFGAVVPDTFVAYHRQHLRLTTLVVGPLMLAEAGTAVAIAALRLSSPTSSWLGVVLLAIVWGATMWLSVPRHDELAHGFALSTHAALVTTNWIRTVAWTARAVLSLTMVADVMHAS